MGYSPIIGRFLERDPIGSFHADATGASPILAAAQQRASARTSELFAGTNANDSSLWQYADSMNLYSFVRDNPINATDPSGLSSSDDEKYIDQLPWYERWEYKAWHSIDAADPNQNQNTTKYLKCVEKCMDDHDPLNAANWTEKAVLDLGQGVPKGLFGQNKGGFAMATGDVSEVTTIGSEITTIAGGARNPIFGRSLRNFSKKISPFANLYNAYMFGVISACAAKCRCLLK